MIVVENPTFHPYSCIQCGVNYNRKWYVDLGLRLENAFQPLFAGNVYFCNECWWNVVEEVERSVEKYLEERGETSEPGILDDFDREPEQLIESSERDDPEPEPSDNTTATDDSNEQTDPVGEFVGFFGP